MIGSYPYTSSFTSPHDLHPARHQVLKPEDMDEYHRTPCLENTRRNVINDIMAWITDDSTEAKKIYGLARTGKSTLSTMIAQIMRGLNRLGAFFFFNRDIPQRNFATLIRTIAYQLAMFDVRFGDAISRVAANNNYIAGMILQFQLHVDISIATLRSVGSPSSLTSNQKAMLPDRLRTWIACMKQVYTPLVCGMTNHSARIAVTY